MTFSQRKNSSGSKGLLSFIQKIETSNETLVLKDNMETDSHSSIDTNKSDQDNLLSKVEINTTIPSEETSHKIQTSFKSTHHSSINNKDSSSINNSESTSLKMNKKARDSITIDLQKIKPNINEHIGNNESTINVHTNSKPKIVSSPTGSSSSQFNINNNTGYSSRSYISGNSDNGCSNYSPHSPLYNLPSYTVTPNNNSSTTAYHSNNSILNNNALSSLSTVSYINSSSNNIREDGEETPLNIITSVIVDSDHNTVNNITINDKEEILDSTDMYSSMKRKSSSKKQKSIYKKLQNQNGDNQHQLPEDYLDIKREDTQMIHDLFKKSICNNFTLQFKDPYTEMNYNRYINSKAIDYWKKCIIILAIGLLVSQIIVLVSLKNRLQSIHLYSVLILDILGLFIPVIAFYYLIYRIKFRILTKIMSYQINAILFLMGPVTILGTNFIIAQIKNPDCDLLMLAYISFFFVGHYLLFYNYIPAMFSIFFYCISWIVSVCYQDVNKENIGMYPYLKIALFCLISAIMIYSLYKKERTSRRQFLNEQRLIRINSKLISQLNRIERGFANEAADLDAPIEKAISTIRSLMASPTIGPEHLKALGMVLCYLQVPNLFAPDLDRQVTQGLKMDDERKKWLFSEVAHRKQVERSKHSSSSESSSATSLSPLYTPSITIQDSQFEYQIINIENFLTNHSAELLTRINDYNFPIFEYFKSTSRPLLTMAYHIFVKSGLLSRLHLSVNQFLNFMSSVEDGYHPEHQFHNAEHASDVLHCIYYFSTIPNIATCFKDLDYLAMYIAACIHDFDHPGVTNKFLISVGDPLAQLYNDKSVLENHHCSAALKLLNKPGCNFLDRLDKEKKRELRETIIELVLATDLSGHFSYLTSFKKKLLDTLTCNTREDRLLLMQMLIKCCDVSNPTKKKPIYKGWINRVMSEFFSQGDREKQLNMTVSAFCNRDNANVYSCQKGFIDFVAAPIFEAVGEYISKFQDVRSGSQNQLQINSANNNNLSRENSLQISNSKESSLVSHDSVTDNEKQRMSSSTTTNDDNSNNNSTLPRQQKSHHHKKTFSKFSLLDSQNRVNVILDGLKSNKEWIDSNAAETETSTS